MARKKPRRPPFTRFSSEALAELRDVLGDSAVKLIPQLQELVREHVTPAEQSRRAEWARGAQGKRPGSAERRRASTALQLAIRRIEELVPFVSSGPTLGSLYGLVAASEAARWRAFRNDAADHLRRLEAMDAYASRPLRGRPEDFDRTWLAHDVAILLRLGGIVITTSRSGKFARVLEIVLSEIHGTAPGNQSKLIQKVARSVNHGTIEELRVLVRKIALYYSNPSFWLLAAQ